MANAFTACKLGVVVNFVYGRLPKQRKMFYSKNLAQKNLADLDSGYNVYLTVG